MRGVPRLHPEAFDYIQALGQPAGQSPGLDYMPVQVLRARVQAVASSLVRVARPGPCLGPDYIWPVQMYTILRPLYTVFVYIFSGPFDYIPGPGAGLTQQP
jgi:hypothetical protein